MRAEYEAAAAAVDRDISSALSRPGGGTEHDTFVGFMSNV